MNPSVKLNICLYSDPNFLALNLLENILSSSSNVSVVTDDVVGWRERTKYLRNVSRFAFISADEVTGPSQFDYVIFCGGFLKRDLAFEDFQKFNRKIKVENAKTIALFPFESFNRSHMDRIKGNDNTALVFIGDLIGPRIDLGSDLFISSLIFQVIQDREMTLGVGELLYPVFISDVVKVIGKWMFSFGPYGKEIFLMGPEVSGDGFWRENQKLLGSIKLRYSNKIKPRILPKGFEVERIKRDLGFSLAETYKWLMSHPFTKSPNKNNRYTVQEEAPPKKKYSKKYAVILISVFSILLLPFFLVAISAGLFYGAYKAFGNGNDTIAKNLIYAAKAVSYISQKESMVLSKIPLLSIVYSETYFASTFEKAAAGLALNAMPLARDGEVLFKNVLGKEVYDPLVLVEPMSEDLDLVYLDITTLDGIVKNPLFSKTLLAGEIVKRVDFQKLKNTVLQSKTLLKDAPQILGLGQSKTYFVLFQNNMELRPTGGFIGSYALVTFDGGRLSDMVVSDVYSADGQLNGHVEPPTPIKEHLGEANWWLRDSNWDPDFPTSAKRAEWFLDKEIGRRVDGVFGVDLYPVKEILKLTGPVFLADYNMDVTSDNLYEKTQKEVEDNFFPGTHRKASFLTALSQNLLNEISSLSGPKKIALIKSLYEGLEGRHLQIYLHNSENQDAISLLNWEGSASGFNCGSTCLTGITGVVEANVGVNKANYFVTRTFNLNTTVSPDGVLNRLTLNIDNNANPVLGASGRYKSYIRFMVPEGSEVVSLQEYVGQSGVVLNPDITNVKGRKEVGVLIEILGGSSKTLQLTWKTSFDPDAYDSYGLYVRKQAGTGEDSLYVSVDGGGISLADPRFTLTKQGSYVYNTTLSRDLFTRITW